MATAKPQIKSTFATPTSIHFLPVANDVNAELRTLVMDKLNAAAGTNGTHGQGWRSANDFASWGNNAAETLFRVIREMADGITATLSGGRVTLDWKISACATVRNKGEYCEL